MKKIDKSFVMTLSVLMILIGCGVHGDMAKTVKPDLLFKQDAVVYNPLIVKQDTTRHKKKPSIQKWDDIYLDTKRAFEEIHAISQSQAANKQTSDKLILLLPKILEQNVGLYNRARSNRLAKDSADNKVIQLLGVIRKENTDHFVELKQAKQETKVTYTMFSIMQNIGLFLVVMFSGTHLILSLIKGEKKVNIV